MLVPDRSGVDRHRKRIFGWLRAGQAVAAVVLLVLAFHTGRTRFVLVTEGVRAPGRIVAYEEQRLRTRGVDNVTRSATTFLPVVEFQVEGRVVTFTDWLGSSAAGGIGNRVTVLYDPARPSVAVIDRPVGNWMPWAPFFAVGAFLMIVAIRGGYVARARFGQGMDDA